MCPSFADLSFIIWQSNHQTLHNERERATHKWVSVEIAWARGRWVCPSILRVNCRGWALFLMGCRELSVRDRKRHHSYAWVGWEQHSVNFTAKLPSKSSINLQVGHNSDGNWKKKHQMDLLNQWEMPHVIYNGWIGKCMCVMFLWTLVRTGKQRMLSLLSIHVH